MITDFAMNAALRDSDFAAPSTILFVFVPVNILFQPFQKYLKPRLIIESFSAHCDHNLSSREIVRTRLTFLRDRAIIDRAVAHVAPFALSAEANAERYIVGQGGNFLFANFSLKYHKISYTNLTII